MGKGIFTQTIYSPSKTPEEELQYLLDFTDLANLTFPNKMEYLEGTKGTDMPCNEYKLTLTVERVEEEEVADNTKDNS